MIKNAVAYVTRKSLKSVIILLVILVVLMMYIKRLMLKQEN